MSDHPHPHVHRHSHTHEEFLAALQAAPQDVSLPLLEQYVADGYVDYVWNTSPSATDAACLSMDGTRGQISDLITGLVHAAPFYEKTHVGCKCTITISGPGLADVVLSAFGVA